ncbi:hypothetical protein NDN08_005807 [Rhodosorus marinus]|nr:hypothetical protein NDN08_005807 [Rhodosorus marinus]
MASKLSIWVLILGFLALGGSQPDDGAILDHEGSILEDDRVTIADDGVRLAAGAKLADHKSIQPDNRAKLADDGSVHADDGAIQADNRAIQVGDSAEFVLNKDEEEDTLEDLSEIQFLVFVKSLANDHPTAEVFANGELSSYWLCVDDDPTQCFFDSQYSERIAFGIQWSSAANLTLLKPTLTNSSAIADAKPLDFKYEREERSGEFSIEYNCVEKGDIKFEIDLPFNVAKEDHVMPEQRVSFSWIKRCPGNETPSGVRMGFIDSEREQPFVYFQAPETNMHVNMFEQATSIFLELDKDHTETNRWFHEPIVSVSDKAVVNVYLELPLENTIYRDQATQLKVKYECLRKKQAIVTLKVPMPPFRDLIAIWVKDCSGAVARGLQVQSMDGSTLWNHEESDHLSSVVIPENQSDFTVQLVNVAKNEEFFFGSTNVISLHPSVALVRVKEPSFSEGMTTTFLRPRGDILFSGATSLLRIVFDCQSRGMSNILVTFSPRKYEKVEVRLSKACASPKRRRV